MMHRLSQRTTPSCAPPEGCRLQENWSAGRGIGNERKWTFTGAEVR